MIGSGIFIVSADIGRLMGEWGPAGLMLVWVVTGMMTMAGALSYVELAAMMPKAGGQYVFLREGLSPAAGFLYGWTLFTVIQAGTIAAVAVARQFLAVLLPGVSDTRHPRVRASASSAANTITTACRPSASHRQHPGLTWINYRGVSLGPASDHADGRQGRRAAALILLALRVPSARGGRQFQ
jgi:APA family basic amino acid/polyamine antiporter